MGNRESDLIESIRRQLSRNIETPDIHWLDAPLTSTNWDGDAHSTTAKTKITLSTEYTVPTACPANIKAVYVKTIIRDSGSAGAECLLRLAPNSTAGSGLETRCSGVGNDKFVSDAFWVPCDVDGNIYYQIAASGVDTFDATIEIWGWEL